MTQSTIPMPLRGALVALLFAGLLLAAAWPAARSLAEVETMETMTTDTAAASPAPAWLTEAKAGLRAELVARHGEGETGRIERGLDQVGSLWRAEDGDRTAFEELVRTHFAGDPATRDALFERFETLLEQIGGHMNETVLALRRQADLDLGPIRPADELFAAYDPSAHVLDDFFANKLAFVVLLNFPLTTLEERLAEGPGWSRRQWAEARLAERFGKRIPAAANQAVSQASAEAASYIAQYNIRMYHLVDDDGRRLFPPGMRLLSHWNLRDEIKASYADGENGLAKQRMIQQVMERIVTQTIPLVAIDNPHVDWNPRTNEVRQATAQDTDEPAPGQLITSAPEPDTRYRMLLGCFEAQRQVDPYSPAAPTLIARRFDEDRELSEERVRKSFDQLLTSPLLAEVAGLIAERLGRPLEPFDIWYNGFRAGSSQSGADLDAIVRERYPTPEAYERDIPRMLENLGFTPERARTIAANIVVEPARGSGHAWGAQMREARTRLRTRVGPEGMDYKGFNIAVHEMGHNVEQTISLDDIDHTLLAGVPNTAFTEALAFVFQAHDLELLGLASPGPEDEALQTLGSFWNAAEIASVALVDMGVWHFMYEHPETTPAELKEATLALSREIWNRYWAPILGQRDVVLLGVYSHMIDSFLYLPDYPIGHLIAYQIEERMRQVGQVGAEFERIARTGRVTPDLWMETATGAPVGPEALLAATRRALDALAGHTP